MKTTKSYAQWFVNECARAAKLGHARMMSPEGVGDGLYLYFRRGELALLEDGPPGYELGTGERVPGNVTVEQLTAWVHQRSTRLPCLPDES